MQRLDPVRVLAHLLDGLEAVEAPLAGGLDGLPRHALVAVVLRRDRPDHLAREAARLVPELALFVVELEIHVGLPRRLTDESIIVLPASRIAAPAQLQSAAGLRRISALFIALTALLAGVQHERRPAPPAAARREAATTSRRSRSSASRRAPRATRSGSAAATPSPTPRASPARSTRPPATATAPPPWCSWTRTTGRARSRHRCSSAARSARRSCSPTAAICRP